MVWGGGASEGFQHTQGKDPVMCTYADSRTLVAYSCGVRSSQITFLARQMVRESIIVELSALSPMRGFHWLDPWVHWKNRRHNGVTSMENGEGRDSADILREKNEKNKEEGWAGVSRGLHCPVQPCRARTCPGSRFVW